MRVVLLCSHVLTMISRPRTCRELLKAEKKVGAVSDEEYKQAQEEYEQALPLIQTLEKRLPRTKTSGENKSSIKEVYVVCEWVAGCGWVGVSMMSVPNPIHTPS